MSMRLVFIKNCYEFKLFFVVLRFKSSAVISSYPFFNQSCSAKVDVTIPTNNQILRLEPSSDCSIETIDGKGMVVCKGKDT